MRNITSLLKIEGKIMREHELKEILEYELDLKKVRRHTGRKGVNFMFCCPFHHESRPSAGILLENGDAYGQCYGCGETFSLGKLVGHVLDIGTIEGINWLEEKYNVAKKEFESTRTLRRYDERQESEKLGKKGRFTLPRAKIAPFRSGKETHKYFFDRGFTKDTVKENLIGWDRVKKRVTVPIFHPDGELAGIIGRAVLEQYKNGKYNPKYRKVYGELPKYYIYENFPIGEVLFGSHDFPVGNDTALLVEGTFDRLWMKQIGFPEALSIIVAKMAIDKKTGASTQKEILRKLGVKKVIFMHDNDKAGEMGKQMAYEILKDDFTCYDTKYPEGWKDPLGDDEHPPLTREQVEKMLANKVRYGKSKRKLTRL
jgi:DNA primase